MATIKSFTDISQSKKLAEILPLESADMYWIHVGDGGDRDFWKVETIQLSWRPYKGIKNNYIPAWSLAALLGSLPFPVLYMEMVAGIIFWCCECHFIETDEVVKIEHYDNPVDACVAMVEKLHELKLL